MIRAALFIVIMFISSVACGLDCYRWLDFESGKRLLLGLDRSAYYGHIDAFMVPGCATSSISISPDNIAEATSEQFRLTLRQPRIGWFRKRMRLDKLEKKIFKRI